MYDITLPMPYVQPLTPFTDARLEFQNGSGSMSDRWVSSAFDALRSTIVPRKTRLVLPTESVQMGAFDSLSHGLDVLIN